MFGEIIPAPLAMPVTVTCAPSTSMRRDAAFGTVSVVMIARTAACQCVGDNAARAAGSARDDPVHRQRFHDHAGRKWQHFVRGATERLRDRRARRARIGEPAFTGSGVGVAGIDQQRARCAT